MSSWSNHVRARLQQRDLTEKLPFVGVFTRLSQLEERYDIRARILDEVECSGSNSLEHGGADLQKINKVLQLQLRESEEQAKKLSQTISDLRAVLYFKDAELQHCQSRVSQYRREGLSMARQTHNLNAALAEFEFTVENQSKDLNHLRAELEKRERVLEEAVRDKERLTERWIEEKRAEAKRLNKHNATQERWRQLARQLQRQVKRERRNEFVPSISHDDGTQKEVGSRETCTTTGRMLHESSSSPQRSLKGERFSKQNTTKCKEYTFSRHDNKYSLKNDISIYANGLGRKKFSQFRRPDLSHFCLCHVENTTDKEDPMCEHAARLSRLRLAQEEGISTTYHRFPHNHKLRSDEAASKWMGDEILWFGKADQVLRPPQKKLPSEDSSPSLIQPELS